MVGMQKIGWQLEATEKFNELQTLNYIKFVEQTGSLWVSSGYKANSWADSVDPLVN